MLPKRIDRDVVSRKIGPYAGKNVSFEDRVSIYEELIGFVPPRIEARMAVSGALDPTIVDMQEALRKHAMYPKCFDVKTAQLMLFGMYINSAVYFEAALVIAMLGFCSTVVLSKFVLRRDIVE